jgi:uncharacterized membrane protein SirB2
MRMSMMRMKGIFLSSTRWVRALPHSSQTPAFFGGLNDVW